MDAQSILDCMGGGNGGVPAVTKAYHEGLNRSVQAMFTVMLCMIFRGISMLSYCDLSSSMVGEVVGFYFFWRRLVLKRSGNGESGGGGGLRDVFVGAQRTRNEPVVSTAWSLPPR